MSQAFTDDCFNNADVAQTVMERIENNDLALKSNFSGTTQPPNAVAGMNWMCTATGHEGQRGRNSANSAWLKYLMGDANSKAWFYRNDACEGWDVDTSIEDMVLSIKGGSNAYNVDGGNTGGTWTQPNHSHSHTHTFSHSHSIKAAGGSGGKYASNTVPGFTVAGTVAICGQSSGEGSQFALYPITATTQSQSTATTNADATESATANTWRPAAAVGTLQYPDLT